MSRVIAVVACGFTLAACSASLPSLSFLRSSPPTEALRIESEPPGAEAKTSLGQSCRTPCELVVQGADELSVTLALNGYQPQTIAVRKEPPQAARDGENAELRLAPNPVYVELQAVPATRAKKPVAAKKKKPVAAAQPAPAAPAAAAAPTGAPPLAPAPAVEAAASATNYPWPSR